MSDQEQNRKWWHQWFRTPAELKGLGVVGINMRNAKYLLPNNPRRLYGLVDDKLQTKALAEKQGLSVPKTYGVITNPHDAARVLETLEGIESFVIKPARGSGGKGVLVIDARKDGLFYKPSGVALSFSDLKHHISNILAGLFSLGGNRDCALIEYRVRPTEQLSQISYQGAPDIRLVMLHGYPVMAMLRAATRESDGRANLHQGALGVGIDLLSGKTIRAVHHGHPVTHHPDVGVDLIGLQLPNWNKILEIAVTCQEMTGLGYLGVDLMIDRVLGPLMIEANARPGLSIQMANGVGLLRRLEPVGKQHQQHPKVSRAGKIEFSMRVFGARFQPKPVLDRADSEP